MARDAKFTMINGIGVLSADNQAKLDSIDKIQEQLTGQSFDETSQTTNFGQDVELTVPQLPVTDLATQGLELASTQRVEDMIDTHFSSGVYIQPPLVVQDFANAFPNTSDCLTAVKGIIGFAYDKDYHFNIVNTIRTKFASVNYVGFTGDTEAQPGVFFSVEKYGTL